MTTKKKKTQKTANFLKERAEEKSTKSQTWATSSSTSVMSVGGIRTYHPKTHHSGMRLFRAADIKVRTNQCRKRLALNSPYLPKTDPPKRELDCHKSPPQEFHGAGKIDVTPEEEMRS